MSFLRAFARNRGAVRGPGRCCSLVAVPWPGWRRCCSRTRRGTCSGAPFAPPGEEGFLLGSDSLGRDVAADIAYGAQRVAADRGGVHRGRASRCWVSRWGRWRATFGRLGGRRADAHRGVLPDHPVLPAGGGAGGDLHGRSLWLHRGGDRGGIVAAGGAGGARRVPVAALARVRAGGGGSGALAQSPSWCGRCCPTRCRRSSCWRA